MSITDAPPSRSREAPLTATNPALLPDGTDQAFRQLVHRLLAFSVRIEAIRSGFGARVGLSGIQYTVLISIAHLQGASGVGVKRIADHLALSGSFVTLVTGQLVKLGFVEKTPNPDDRRRVRLVVTEQGHALLSELAPVQCEVNDLLFQPLDAGRFALLNAVFGELVKSADEAASLIDYLSGNGRDVPPPAPKP